MSGRLVRCPHGCGQEVSLSYVDSHVLHLCTMRRTGDSAVVENGQRLLLVKMNLLLDRSSEESDAVVKGDAKGDVAVLQRKLDETRKRLEEADIENERLHCIIYGKSRSESLAKGQGQVKLEVHSAGFECGNYARVILGEAYLHITTGRGFNIVVLDRTDYSVVTSITFDVYGDRSTSTKFAQFIADQPHLSVLCIVLKDEGSRYLGDTAKDTIVALTGRETIRGLSHRVGYALIAIKGYPEFSIENMSSRGRAAHVKYILPVGGVKELLERGRPDITTNKFSQEVTEITAAYRS